MLCRERLRLTLYSQMKKSAATVYIFTCIYVGARVNYCELKMTSLLFATSLYDVLYSIKFFCPIR